MTLARREEVDWIAVEYRGWCKGCSIGSDVSRADGRAVGQVYIRPRSVSFTSERLMRCV